MQTSNDISRFQELIKTHYRRFGRTFPWRDSCNPYEITVSEIMLQQTGTERVLKKYQPFIEAFPSFEILSSSSLKGILSLWQGLGYNRRAKFLKELSQIVCRDFGGILPEDPSVLRKFPGIGPGTAGSLAAFIYNKPVVFIETNIRRVFLHFFFTNCEKITDKEIFPLIEASLDNKNPRIWYYALMDYGVYLKSLYPNANKRSAHYSVQSRFENSNRQVRGKIIKLLTETDDSKKELFTAEEIADSVGFDITRVKIAVEELTAEGIVAEKNNSYRIN